ncbi:hypothetical protein HC931_25685 [Candidatus Gracilibacteria bacterium]|nr:hypothetical protein [Candidatus Gracilibacteria bacterium]
MSFTVLIINYHENTHRYLIVKAANKDEAWKIACQEIERGELVSEVFDGKFVICYCYKTFTNFEDCDRILEEELLNSFFKEN